jgi:NAD+ diphosphatase
MSEERPSFLSAVHHPTGPLGRCLWIAVRNREVLVTSDFQLKTQEKLSDIGLEPVRTQYLGRLDELHCFSAELPGDAPIPEGFRFADLRSLLGHFDDWLHALAGRAVQIVEWERSHQFCGECGAPTEHLSGERARRCPGCQRVFYPRLAPSMIVAVERGDEILLGRSPHFPPGIYSVLAGFVEPGESLEESVAREVREEAGIEVKDVRYFSSQPWPFPNSLMIGFTAQYAGGEVQPDGVEVEDAAFFRWDELPRTFPGNVSISQWLIQDFVERRRRGQ